MPPSDDWRLEPKTNRQTWKIFKCKPSDEWERKKLDKLEDFRRNEFDKLVEILVWQARDEKITFCVVASRRQIAPQHCCRAFRLLRLLVRPFPSSWPQTIIDNASKLSFSAVAITIVIRRRPSTCFSVQTAAHCHDSAVFFLHETNLCGSPRHKARNEIISHNGEATQPCGFYILTENSLRCKNAKWNKLSMKLIDSACMDFLLRQFRSRPAI